MGKGGAGPVCFCLVSPGRWRQQLHSSDPRTPHPRHVAGGAGPPDRLQDSAVAEARCGPGARAAPRTASCSVSRTAPHPCSPLSPHRSLPSENPAGGVVAWSGVGEAAPTRMAMTWDMETVTSASSSPCTSRRRHVCGQCRLELGFNFVLFCFLWIRTPFAKTGY